MSFSRCVISFLVAVAFSFAGEPASAQSEFFEKGQYGGGVSVGVFAPASKSSTNSTVTTYSVTADDRIDLGFTVSYSEDQDQSQTVFNVTLQLSPNTKGGALQPAVVVASGLANDGYFVGFGLSSRVQSDRSFVLVPSGVVGVVRSKQGRYGSRESTVAGTLAVGAGFKVGKYGYFTVTPQYIFTSSDTDLSEVGISLGFLLHGKSTR